MGLLDAIEGPLLYLDTNIFIYAVESVPPFSDAMRELFRHIDDGHCQAVTSELSLAECLVKPFLEGDMIRRRAFERAVQTSPVLQVIPISRTVLVSAAELRARTGLKLPDAIHLATATHAGCATFLTNDRRFLVAPRLRTLVLSDFVSESSL